MLSNDQPPPPQSFPLHPPAANFAGETIELQSRAPSESEAENLLVHDLSVEPRQEELNTPDNTQRTTKTKYDRATRVIQNLWFTVWLPICSCAFLSFCYIVHYRTIRVKVWNIEDPLEHLSIIKAGVTSFSILIICIALLPMYTLISDLRSEEFFRILNLKNAAPLASINSYFTGAVFITFVGVAASTLAPAALSVQVVQVDGDIQAFRVGAIFRNTVWNSTIGGVVQNGQVTQRLAYAGAVPWVDLIAGLKYGWTATSESQYNYAVPTSLDVTLGTRLRYLTDVIKIQPVCSWKLPDSSTPTETFPMVFNFTDALPRGLSVSPPHSTGDLDTNRMMETLNTKPSILSPLKDLEGEPIIDGTIVLVIRQCYKNCYKYFRDDTNPIPEAHINLKAIPTAQFASAPVSNDSDTSMWDVSFLVCTPNLTIEAREVEMDDEGGITVNPLIGNPRPLQGNLNLAQTNLLLGQALSNLRNSGPTIQYLGKTDDLGGAGQVVLVFGRDAVNPRLDGKYVTEAEAIITPLPISNITANYGRSIHGAMKALIDGSLAAAYVPCRTNDHVLVFSSSLPHIITSTVFFAFLSVFMVVCHLRKPVAQFSFVHVATALARSDCPLILEDVMFPAQSHSDPMSDEAMMASIGARVLLMTDGARGNQVIHMSSWGSPGVRGE